MDGCGIISPVLRIHYCYKLQENPVVLRRTFFIKLDVRRKSIVTLALSQDNHFDCRKIVCKSGPYAASPASAYSNLHATECRVFELGLSTSIRNAQLSETLYPTELIGPH